MYRMMEGLAWAYEIWSPFLTAAQAGSDVPDHNAKFTIDEDTLLTGVQLHVTTALEFLRPSP